MKDGPRDMKYGPRGMKDGPRGMKAGIKMVPEAMVTGCVCVWGAVEKVWARSL